MLADEAAQKLNLAIRAIKGDTEATQVTPSEMEELDDESSDEEDQDNQEEIDDRISEDEEPDGETRDKRENVDKDLVKPKKKKKRVGDFEETNAGGGEKVRKA
jgi:hypothetical protein